MTPSESKQINESVDGFSTHEKLQLTERLARLLQTTPDRSPLEKREALVKLRKKLADLPVANPDDGLSNRDDDRLVYAINQIVAESALVLQAALFSVAHQASMRIKY